MKRVIWFISVLSLMFLLANCTDKDSKQFVEIPDANFKEYLLENFDTNQDGNISLSEAKVVLEINCSNRNIETLDGIEKFENLERLICNDNQLDELELRYNKKLSWLVCNNNKVPLTIYFGMSGSLLNKNFVIPKENETPEVAQLINPFDVSKGVFDLDETNFILCFND